MNKIIKLITTPSSSSIILSPGTYTFECWGAQGGTGLGQGEKMYQGGKGAYASGVLALMKKTRFYLFVGGKGADGDPAPNTIANGGYNGGGKGGPDTSDDEGSGGGGGSSDIRLINGEWNDTKSIFSRIIVAAGGSGSADEGIGAPGGALNGYKPTADCSETYAYSTTSQTNGYELGVGEDGRPHSCTPSSGAGGGYYGGKAADGIDIPTYMAVSSSGTSFVSGYKGCIAVDENRAHTDSSIHYSKLEFINPIMKSGIEEFPSPTQKEEKGHSGDGSILITLLSSSNTCYRKNNKSHFIISLILINMYS